MRGVHLAHTTHGPGTFTRTGTRAAQKNKWSQVQALSEGAWPGGREQDEIAQELSTSYGATWNSSCLGAKGGRAGIARIHHSCLRCHLQRGKYRSFDKNKQSCTNGKGNHQL
uniref:Uncharacterized protein n=1 Tax=Sphaerodactylus townsendi TaxID=933632 RepID=A0ACB8ECR0_9SAUR